MNPFTISMPWQKWRTTFGSSTGPHISVQTKQRIWSSNSNRRPRSRCDIAEHDYEYYFVIDEAGKAVGYVGIAPERFSDDLENPHAKAHGEAITPLHADRLFISKIYLYAEERGKHYSSQILEWLRDYARKLGLTGMYLTVNKGNELGIRAYKGNGFDIIESVEADIGNGFVMDDYIMACAV